MAGGAKGRQERSAGSRLQAGATLRGPDVLANGGFGHAGRTGLELTSAPTRTGRGRTSHRSFKPRWHAGLMAASSHQMNRLGAFSVPGCGRPEPRDTRSGDLAPVFAPPKIDLAS